VILRDRQRYKEIKIETKVDTERERYAKRMKIEIEVDKVRASE